MFLVDRMQHQVSCAYLRASSSRRFASNSLLGGYLGKLEGLQAYGFVVKNYKRNSAVIVIYVIQCRKNGIEEQKISVPLLDILHKSRGI